MGGCHELAGYGEVIEWEEVPLAALEVNVVQRYLHFSMIKICNMSRAKEAFKVSLMLYDSYKCILHWHEHG